MCPILAGRMLVSLKRDGLVLLLDEAVGIGCIDLEN